MLPSYVDGDSGSSNIVKPAPIREMTTGSTVNAAYAKNWAVNRFNNWWTTGASRTQPPSWFGQKLDYAGSH